MLNCKWTFKTFLRRQALFLSSKVIHFVILVISYSCFVSISTFNQFVLIMLCSRTGIEKEIEIFQTINTVLFYSNVKLYIDSMKLHDFKQWLFYFIAWPTNDCPCNLLRIINDILFTMRKNHEIKKIYSVFILGHINILWNIFIVSFDQ